MKKAVLMIAAGAVWLTACGSKEKSGEAGTTNAAGESVLTAPVDYLGAAAKAKTASERTIEAISVNQAISLFHAAEGRYPKDLNELVAEQYLPQLPVPPHGMKFEYDAARGQAKIVPK